MAHEFETGIFIKDRAWHGLGTVIQEAPSFEDALRLAGLDWTVSTRPLLVDGDSTATPITTGHKAVVRDSDQTVLGVVGARYCPLQNAKAFEPFQPLIDSGLVELSAAVSLRHGQRIAITAKMKGADADVVPGDQISGFLVFYQGHDGLLGASYQQSNTRIVCANTLAVAMRAGDNGKEKRVTLRHTAGINQQVDAITMSFEQGVSRFYSSIENYKTLTRKQCNRPETYFKAVLKMSEKTNGLLPVVYGSLPEVLPAIEPDTTGKRQLAQLLEAYETQPGRDFAPGTYWQAANAVTYWVDHVRGRSTETRLNASMFGEGSIIRNRAFDVALAA